MNQTETVKTRQSEVMEALNEIRQRSSKLAYASREPERGNPPDLEHVYRDVVAIREAAAKVGKILFELGGVPEEPTW